MKRCLPVSSTLCVMLRKYVRSSAVRRNGNDYLFLTNHGKKLRRLGLSYNFRRLCLRAGILQHQGITVTPGLHDLRHTFAVHTLEE